MGAAGRDPPTGNYLGCDLVRIPKCRTEQFKSLYEEQIFQRGSAAKSPELRSGSLFCL